VLIFVVTWLHAALYEQGSKNGGFRTL
jgi:hypothetical protein